jgi:hypothetical protein
MAVVSIVVEDGRISRIHAMANPNKLTRLNGPADLAVIVGAAFSKERRTPGSPSTL